MLCSPTFCLLKVTFEFRGERVLRPHDAPRSAEAIVDRRYSVEQVVAREISVAVDTIAKGPNKIEVDFIVGSENTLGGGHSVTQE